MFDKKIVPHEHIGDKSIRLDNKQDEDGNTYTDSELAILRNSDNEIHTSPIGFIIEAESIDADNDGIFVNIKRAGSLEDVQIG